MNHGDFEVIKYKFTLKVCLLQLLISWIKRQIFTLRKVKNLPIYNYGTMIKPEFFKN